MSVRSLDYRVQRVTQKAEIGQFSVQAKDSRLGQTQYFHEGKWGEYIREKCVEGTECNRPPPLLSLHFPGVSKLHAWGAPPRYSLEDKAVGPEGNDGPSESECYASGSSLHSASCAAK